MKRLNTGHTLNRPFSFVQTMPSSDYKSRQEDELQCILAIFDTALDIRKPQKKKNSYRPPEVAIVCVPQSSDSGGAIPKKYATIELKIKLHSEYPDKLPELNLANAVGLSDKLVSELKKALFDLAYQKKGQEMMYDLIIHTQTFLYQHNKPPAASFFDQMMESKQRAAEEKTRQQLEAEIQEDLEIDAEIALQRVRMQEAKARRRLERKVSECERPQATDSLVKRPAENEVDITSRQALSRLESDSPCTNPEHSQTVEINLKRSKREVCIIRGKCTKHRQNFISFSSLDKSTGDHFNLHQWTFDLNVGLKVDRKTNLAKCQQTLNSWEQDFTNLLKLDQPNLVKYAMFDTSTNGLIVTASVLIEPSFSSTLPELLAITGFFHLPTIQFVCTGVLQALVFLHDKQIIHRNISPYCIHTHNRLVKLSEHGVYRKLNDLQKAVALGDVTRLDNPGVKLNQKDDVFKLGLVMLYMITEEFDDQNTLPSIPKNLDTILSDIIRRCSNPDEKSRSTAKQLSSHSFITQPCVQRANMISKSEPDEPSRHEDSVDEDGDDLSDSDDLINDVEYFNRLAGATRLDQEFTILGIIGSGGFGEVLKARNRLDRCLYAIKRITLNPKSEQYKRITREVKLLSRLNHENVVRYYNSWIEKSDKAAESDVSSDYTTTNNTTEPQNAASPAKHEKNSIGEEDSIERLAPPPPQKSVGWSTVSYRRSSYRHVASARYGDSDSDDSDDEGGFFASRYTSGLSTESDGILFEGEREDDSGSESESDGKQNGLNTSAPADSELKLQFMFIQMEYCEKNTLRQAIDSNLFEDENRVWRLFREIIEGLSHIHEQGIIHRDLKPVNIFLDSKDHVKIGDFGLATTALVGQNGSSGGTPWPDSTTSGRSLSMGDGKHTGQVGTLLYVSPEIIKSTGKTSYTQKVDIYSVGIIFFEMCYKPPATLMERDMLIGNLRQEEINLPKDFNVLEKTKQVSILRWVLNHDPNKRPSSQELLQSSLLPVVEWQQQELDDLISSTVAERESRGYKRLLTTIFTQKVSRAFDVKYDHNEHTPSWESTSRWMLCRSIAQSRLERVYTRHGAVNLNIPILIPKQALYKELPAHVVLMDHAGNLVSLPSDLRIPFARYAARNKIDSIKRYCINRVFHERRPFGIQPHEIWHTAFDIVSPNPDSLLADAEVLSVVQDVLDEFPVLQEKGYVIQLNHIQLLKSVLLHCDIPEERHNHVYRALAQSSSESERSLAARLMDSKITEVSANQLAGFIEMNGTLTAVAGFLKRITKASSENSSRCKTALHELEAIISYSKALNPRLNISVNLGFLNDAASSSGMMFQVCAQLSRRGREMLDIIAAGYRYDQLLRHFSRIRSDPLSSSAVGFSLHFDRLCHSVNSELREKNLATCDVLILLNGKMISDKEKLHLLREFWDEEVKAAVHQDNSQLSLDFDAMVKFCRETGISYLLSFNDADLSTVKVKTIDPQAHESHDRKYRTEEVVKIIRDKLNETHNPTIKPKRAGSVERERESRGVENEGHGHPRSAPLSITVWFNSTQKQGLLKRKKMIESKVMATLAQTVLSKLKRSGETEVFAVEFSKLEVKLLADCCTDSNDEMEFNQLSAQALNSLGSTSSRKQLAVVFEKLSDALFKGSRPQVMVIVGFLDYSYRLIMH